MKREVHELIEAVRGLGLRLTGRPSPASVRIAGDPKTFPERLKVLQESLETFDAASAHGSHDGPDAPELSPKDDPERLKQALDGLLRFVQASGGDLDAAVNVVAKALDIEGKAKKKSAYVTLPKFAPNGFKKKKNFKPKLSILGDKAFTKLEDLRKQVFDVSITQDMLGETIGKESKLARKRVEEMKAETAGEIKPPSL
ncbi:hypothetical protein [Roseibium sp. RKSG952]|uniref:hypothetical protein n=1 Tax=Roseibium sp. RKSG952 TaxID=2529384 RepID=UPI0012BB8780|nr:hypothetical protein [Roseibium sp. RKSG952]MTH95916.1 hypothetical protein [Roseibium sp. RKSG952]